MYTKKSRKPNAENCKIEPLRITSNDEEEEPDDQQILSGEK